MGKTPDINLETATKTSLQQDWHNKSPAEPPQFVYKVSIKSNENTVY